MRNGRPVLLVDDDRVDVMTVKRAMRDLKITNPLSVVANGEEALAFLRDPGNATPCIILLDLNMPRMSGIEFLRVAKGDDDLRGIPVVVLTTSQEDQDKADSFDLGVAGYLVKPSEYTHFVDVVRTVHRYWSISEIPHEV
jgi:CheY-like chemotaxis protein